MGVSSGAVFFNVGLIAGGVCITLFMAGLVTIERGRWLRAAALAGVAAGICATLVGVFPMNQLIPHLAVASAFFHLGLVVIVLFSIHALRSRRLPNALVWAGLPAIAGFAALLVLIRFSPFDPRDLPLDFRRPAIWPLPLVEWVMAIATLGWIAVVSGFLYRWGDTGGGGER